MWEVVATARDNDKDLKETAAYLEVPQGLVEAAVSYYGDYNNEIDGEIELNESEWRRGYEAFEAGRQALG